ncbi:MAG: ABC transporter ATP-binding protein [Dehalococcoidia bacterium]|nr:ABC transporter ATP-binding protein [Dehalococcoidia bacterium]
MKLILEGVTVSIDRTPIVSNTDLHVEPGEFVGLVGPNGSGKSTLLRSIYRVLRPDSGAVCLDTDDVWRLRPKDVARRVSVVTQESAPDFDFTVFEMALMGRTPHKGMLESDSAHDREIVIGALERTGVLHLADRVYATLSGGEKQRVLLARALAQQGRVLILDEPTNHLDIRAQLQLLRLVCGLRVTTIAAIHDLNLAATFCDRLYVLRRGQVVASGSPSDVLTDEVVGEVFGVRCHRLPHPLGEGIHFAFTELDAEPPPTTARKEA